MKPSSSIAIARWDFRPYSTRHDFHSVCDVTTQQGTALPTPYPNSGAGG